MSPTIHPEQITITIKGVQRALDIGPTTVYKLIGQGKLTAVKIGRRTLVTTDSIRALVDQAA